MNINDFQPLPTKWHDETELTDEMRNLANMFFRGATPQPGDRRMPESAPYILPAQQGWLATQNMPETALPGTAPYYFMWDRAKAKQKSYDVDAVRGDFPILRRMVHGRPLVWLDNAATTQKPQAVIDEMNRFYTQYNSNVHRGAHQLSREATDAFEAAREKTRAFIGASSKEEVIFVRGATEAINLAAHSWGMTNLHPGDEILLTEMEHHSNIVPWQLLAEKTGAVIKAAPINERGELMLEQYARLFTPRTRLAAVAHVSNVLGTVNPVRQMADIAHSRGALILVDGAQSTPHMPVDVQEMDADFFAFSGHKLYGPTGIGVLYGKKELLQEMPPYQSGGGMIRSVSMERTVFDQLPGKFEAGTGAIAEAIGLCAAMGYLQGLGMEKIQRHEMELTAYLMKKLGMIPRLRVIGTAPAKTSVVSFVLEGMEPAFIAKALDQEGIAIRVGHHCAQPVLRHFGLTSMARASIGLYNTYEEMDKFANVIAGIAAQYV
jgi:cysteine desulfurase/selenocysteine lyase